MDAGYYCLADIMEETIDVSMMDTEKGQLVFYGWATNGVNCVALFSSFMELRCTEGDTSVVFLL